MTEEFTILEWEAIKEEAELALRYDKTVTKENFPERYRQKFAEIWKKLKNGELKFEQNRSRGYLEFDIIQNSAPKV